MKGIGEVDRSWGLSSDWFLDLRDGRHLRIQVDLRAPVVDAHQKEEVITQKLIHWISSQWVAFDSSEGEDDSKWDMGNIEVGSDISGAESELDNPIIPVRPDNALSMVLVNGRELSMSNPL